MSSHGRAADRDGDVPLQRRRGLDRAAPAPRRRVRERAARAPGDRAGGRRLARRRDRRPARRGDIRRVLGRLRRGRGGGRDRATSGRAPDARAHRPPYRGAGAHRRRATSGWTSTGRRGSAAPATAGRSCSRPRHAHSSPTGLPRISGSTCSRASRQPEQLYQLLEEGLPQNFAALRVLPTARKSKRRRQLATAQGSAAASSSSHGQSGPGCPATAPDERAAVSRLAAALIAAARSSSAAERFVASVDRRAIERDLSRIARWACTSERASDAADLAARRLALLDALGGALGVARRPRRRPTPRPTRSSRQHGALDAGLGGSTSRDRQLERSNPSDAPARDPPARRRVPRGHDRRDRHRARQQLCHHGRGARLPGCGEGAAEKAQTRGLLRYLAWCALKTTRISAAGRRQAAAEAAMAEEEARASATTAADKLRACRTRRSACFGSRTLAVCAVLRSPLHRLLSRRLLLLDLSRPSHRAAHSRSRSGTSSSTTGGSRAVALRPEGKDWWRTFREPSPASLTVRGSTQAVTGALTDAHERVSVLARYSDGSSRLERATRGAAVVVFTPTR